MKLCNTHQHDLLGAIVRKGMGDFVSANGQEAGEKAKRWLAGQLRDHTDFDPLVVSTLEIFQKAQQMFGALGEKCPCCAADYYVADDTGDTWIDNVTDMMVLVCETNHMKRG